MNELDAILIRVNRMAEQQARDHEVASAAVQNVIALTNAVIPVMLACRDTVVLERFKAEMERITAATDAMVARLDGKEAH